MLALKYPELEKPVFCAKKMSLWDKWKDIRFHKNLWKVDERMLFEQARIDGHTEGVAQGHAEGHAEGLAEAREEILKLLEQGLSIEEIKKQLKQKEEALN
jgi:flagellar biosynthesis/type III secretory pathway protein FliH